MRRLKYVVVAVGKCAHCKRDAGDHSIEGICRPATDSHQRYRDEAEPCFSGTQVFGFVDQDSPHEFTAPLAISA